MRPPVVVDKLTPQQQIFCERMAILGVGRLAAMAAGYSVSTADRQASRLLSIGKIAREVERQRRRRVEAVDIEAAEVLATLANIMRTDVRDVMGWDDDGSWFEPSDSLTRSVAAAIKEVKVIRRIDRRKSGEEIETVETRVVMHDKIAAASKLAELMSMLPDRHGIGGPVHVGDNVQMVMTGPEMLEAVQRVYGLAQPADVIEGE